MHGKVWRGDHAQNVKTPISHFFAFSLLIAANDEARAGMLMSAFGDALLISHLFFCISQFAANDEGSRAGMADMLMSAIW